MNPLSVTTWRLAVVASAATGVVLAAQQYDVWWTALSQLANAAVALSFLVLAFREPESPWLRGALTTLMMLVGLAYLPMQNGNLTDPYSVFEHILTPSLVVLDFALVGRNHGLVRWWHPVTWLVAPLAYLLWYVDSGLAVYPALDPGQPAVFTERIALLLALLLAVGYALYGFGQKSVSTPSARSRSR